MLERFIRHIREKNILDFKRQYLLAISGGLDSTMLAHLLHQSGVSFSMAHCNFELRGEESEGDAIFVRELAAQMKVDLYLKHFETKSYAKNQGISTQMAARDLRYQWFDELLKQHDLAGIIVAHHADDQLETILLNLLRGTGIEGIYGMSEIRGNIVRPLLPFRRDALETYAADRGYQWREDKTNASIDYKRNYLRHQVLPPLGEFDPAAISLLQFSFDRLKDTGKAFFHLYDFWLTSNIKHEGEFSYLEISKLENVPGKKALLFYWLRTYGFTYSQMDDILLAVNKRVAGKLFLSADHSLNLDRNHLIVGNPIDDFEEVWIEASDIGVQIGEEEYDLLALNQDITPPGSSSAAMLDKSRLNFPLKIRRWEQGDRFRPLGMKSFKKVSDLLIDLKVPLIHKRNVRVLCSGDDIVWVIGLRIDDRFKVSSLTQSALYIKKRRKIDASSFDSK